MSDSGPSTADRVVTSPSLNHLAAGQTLLAWRRTALQVAAVGIIAARMLTERLGVGVIVASAVGVLVGMVVHASAGRAYAAATGRRGHLNPRGKAIVAQPRVRLTVLAGLSAAVGVGAVVWILRSGI